MIQYIEILYDTLNPNLWIIGEDFNLILSLGVKKGRHMHIEPKAEELPNFIYDSNLVDIKKKWNLNLEQQEGRCFQISPRLDSFLVAEHRLTGSDDVVVDILTSMGPYHWPIYLS